MKMRKDIDYWKQRFITGSDEVTLKSLSEEPNSPSYSTLKKISMRELWVDQRKRYRNQTLISVPEVKEAAKRAEQVIDLVDMLCRHARAAKLLGEKAIEALKALDSSKLKPADIAQFIRIAVEIERLTEGLATVRLAESSTVQVEVNNNQISAEVVNLIRQQIYGLPPKDSFKEIDGQEIEANNKSEI